MSDVGVMPNLPPGNDFNETDDDENGNSSDRNNDDDLNGGNDDYLDRNDNDGNDFYSDGNNDDYYSDMESYCCDILSPDWEPLEIDETDAITNGGKYWMK